MPLQTHTYPVAMQIYQRVKWEFQVVWSILQSIRFSSYLNKPEFERIASTHTLYTSNDCKQTGNIAATKSMCTLASNVRYKIVKISCRLWCETCLKPWGDICTIVLLYVCSWIQSEKKHHRIHNTFRATKQKQKINIQIADLKKKFTRQCIGAESVTYKTPKRI